MTYSEVRMRYLAGFTQIPDRVKLALVEIMQVLSSRQVSMRKMQGINKIQNVFTGEGFISSTAKDLLSPYTIQALM